VRAEAWRPYWEGKITRGGHDAAIRGELLADRYELHECVGWGGMGAVWRASDRDPEPHSADGRVAVKILKPELAQDPDCVERFRREARTLERLDHPNIVRAFAYGSEGVRHFIVMEYLDGRNGKQLVEEAAPLEPGLAAEIIAQACEGLACVHGENVVHRDIKPANLMIAGGPGEGGALTVKLTDFGIVRNDDDTALTKVGVVVGTPAYLAPEYRFDGAEPTNVSDIYSMGVMLYELLTGRLPQSPPVPPAKHDISIPRGLSAATMCALERTPACRFGEVESMRQAVLAGAAGKDVSGLLPTRVQPGPTAFMSGTLRRAARQVRRRGPTRTSEPPIDWGDILKMILVGLVGMVGIVVVARLIAVVSALPDALLVCLTTLLLVAILVARRPAGRRAAAKAASAVWLGIRPLADSELTNVREQEAARGRLRVGALRLMRLLILVGLIVYWGLLTYHLAPSLEDQIDRLPSSQRLPFEITTAAVWLLCGFVPLVGIALSRARRRRIAVAGLVLVFVWTAGAELLPDAPSSLAPLIWPNTRREAIKERVSAEAGRWKELLHRRYARRSHGPPPRRIMQQVRATAHRHSGALRQARERHLTRRAKRQARHWISRMRLNRRRWGSRYCSRHPGRVYVDLRPWGVAVACRR
jgi:serine/threonine protein kinase